MIGEDDPPLEIVAGEAPVGQAIRVGGMVVEGSVRRGTDSLTVDARLRHREELEELVGAVLWFHPATWWLLAQIRLALAELVEEELLLAVPQVPRNPELEEDAGNFELSADVKVEDSSAQEKEQTHRPFEGLAGLMKQSGDD